MLSPIAQILERVEKARDDSDVAFFYDLLHAGEMIVKLATAGLTACIEDDRERNRYRLEFDLIHADGLGAWRAALNDALTGPASQMLAGDARGLQRELTQTFRLTDDEWQAEAVSLLYQARLTVDKDATSLPSKVGARRWFEDFVALRNRTRGHGATTSGSCSHACIPLRKSISLLVDNLTLFRLPWVHLHRNLSGKYRVTDIGNGVGPFDHLKSSPEYAHVNGIYLWLGQPRYAALVTTDDDIRDFYFPNSASNGNTYDALSYITDTRRTLDATPYVSPPTALPASETQGLGELDVIGNVFANLPPRVVGYIKRDGLERELAAVLKDDRHPVITLVGRGGIGKTSLALEVLHDIALEDRFFTMIWFSARDIELLPTGPKRVQPQVLSSYDIAQEYVKLIDPTERHEDTFKPSEFFSQALSQSPGAPSLFIFDNFETVSSPIELHRWLDSYIRSPNKILITTRNREFKGDYWVEVGGMTEDQFAALVNQTANELKMADLITDSYITDLYKESDGHPYIAKVLLGEVARAGKRQKVQRIMASQDRVLDALFDRTFAQLTPAAQRIFLTLSSWHSLVPVVALEVAVNRPESDERLDVERAIEDLRRSSFLQISSTKSGDSYISIPLSASLFGRRKLGTSPLAATVDADIEVLQLFGAVPAGASAHGFDSQVEKLFRNVANKLQREGAIQYDHYRPVLEFVARERPFGWIFLAQLLEEYRPYLEWPHDAAEAYRHYLEVVPNDGQIWLALARVCKAAEDSVGEVQALIQRAKLSDAPYADIGYAAARVNACLANGTLELDTDEKRILISSLVEVMDNRKLEATAADMSSLAWLLINNKKRREARVIIREGLKLDPTSMHCRKLATKLKITADD